MTALRVRWLGRVPYAEADELQRALLERAADDYLLLLEHPHVYTLGKSADPAHVLVPPASVGADLVRTDRGGDVTYHGPGQLVGYPIVTLPEWRAGQRDVVAYVRRLEAVLIVGARRPRRARPTVTTGTRACGSAARRSPPSASGSSRGRTRHGFALNVDPDLSMFGHIVPCGIADRGVTSLAAQLGAAPDMHDVVDAVTARFAEHFPYARRRTPGRRLARAGADDLSAFTPRRVRRSRGSRPRRSGARCACSAGWRKPASRRRPRILRSGGRSG